MEIKNIIKKGSELLDEAARMFYDKEYQDKMLQKGAEAVKGASAVVADVTAKTVRKTMDYAEENRLMPGSKDKYIAWLEEELRKKDREIITLKKNLIRRNRKRF